MKRFSAILKDRKGSISSDAGSSSASSPPDSPDTAATQAIKAFCESNTTSTTGNEVTHLPTIVENAVSSPAAAKACATQLRKFISMKEQNSLKKSEKKELAHVQYNAIMLLRILVDNPGPSFTKNIDAKFVDTIKAVLRLSLNPSVQQIMRETLDNFELQKAPQDNNLLPLVAMWRKEKLNMVGQFAQMQASQSIAMSRSFQPGQFPQAPPSNKLPPPIELSSRVEEARTSAKLLIQFVQSTPASEVSSNDLIKEFAARCQAAQRSMQGYMNATDPSPPDPDTFQTLIETCEQLNVASSKYQRAVLAVRRTQSGTNGASPATSPPPQGALQQPPMRTQASQQPPMPTQASQQTNGAVNPFGDENQIPENEGPNFAVYRQDHPDPSQTRSVGRAAMSLGATAAQQQAALDAARAQARASAAQTSFSPPPGAPPVKQHQDEKSQAETSVKTVAAADDDDDLYGPPSARPSKAATSIFAGTSFELSAEPERSTGPTTNGIAGTRPEMSADPQQSTSTASEFSNLRIKDDTAFPIHSGSGSNVAESQRPT